MNESVTGLRGRTATLERIGMAADAVSAGEHIAFMSLGVGEYPEVSDALGYVTADRLMAALADRLRATAQEFGIPSEVSLIAIDRFGILLTGLGKSEPHASRTASEVAQRVLDAVSGRADLGQGIAIDVAPRIGWVLVRPPGQDRSSTPETGSVLVSRDPNEIVKCAGAARRQCGGTDPDLRIRRFDQRMLDEALERVSLVSQLRSGISDGQLGLFAQPIVDRDRRVTGFEGLIRWRHPERGVVLPDEFIPLAESTGMIVEIGALALEEACRALAGWAHDPGLATCTLSINLSARELRIPSLEATVRASIERYGVLPGRLGLELTETALHRDLDHTRTLLERLSTVGVFASLDDFGTGFSSLSYLCSLPVQQLKIDRSFVRDVARDERSEAVVRMIVELARVFGLRSVAEGVEEEAQFVTLRELGVDAFQGYLFGASVPVEEVAAFVR